MRNRAEGRRYEQRQGGSSRGVNFDELRSKCVTLFVDNLPERINNHRLRNVFRWFGDIADVFVPNKRRRGSNYRYGFVRFYCQKDADLAIHRANEAWCWNRKILVKRAQFSGNVHSKKEAWSQKGVKKFIWKRKESSGSDGRNESGGTAGFSPNDPNDHKVVHNSNAIETIQIMESEDDWLQRCAVGKVINIKLLAGLQEAIISEGILDISIKFLGGMLVLLEFHSLEIMKTYLEDTTWFSRWFSDVKAWKQGMMFNERLVWLNITGVPLNVWSVANFERIGERFGLVISVDSNTANKKLLDRGRILVSTKLRETILKDLLLELKTDTFLITVREESGVGFSFHSLQPTCFNKQGTCESVMDSRSDGLDGLGLSTHVPAPPYKPEEGSSDGCSGAKNGVDMDDELDSNAIVDFGSRGIEDPIIADCIHEKFSNSPLCVGERNGFSVSQERNNDARVTYKDVLIRNGGLRKSKSLCRLEVVDNQCISRDSEHYPIRLRRASSLGHLRNFSNHGPYHSEQLFGPKEAKALDPISRPTSSCPTLVGPNALVRKTCERDVIINNCAEMGGAHTYPVEEDSVLDSHKKDLRKAKFQPHVKRKRRLLDELLGWPKICSSTTRIQKKKGRRNSKARRDELSISSSFKDDSSISDGLITCRNRLLLEQAQDTWNLVNRLGVKSLGNDQEVVEKLAEIIKEGGAGVN